MTQIMIMLAICLGKTHIHTVTFKTQNTPNQFQLLLIDYLYYYLKNPQDDHSGNVRPLCCLQKTCLRTQMAVFRHAQRSNSKSQKQTITLLMQ